MLICNGPLGTFFEIDESKNIVWKYINPVTPDNVLTQGESPVGINSVFHILRLSVDYPAFDGKVLEPGASLVLTPDIETVTRIYEDNPDSDLLLYPNPVTGDIITIIGDEILMDLNIAIYDSFGNRIEASITVEVDKIQLHFDNLETGIYFIRFGTKNIKFFKL